MKLFIPVIYMLFSTQQTSLFEARRLYASSAIEKDSLVKLIKLVNNAKPHEQPVLYCYHGAAQIIMAKYAFSPFTKFSDFKKGRAMMEDAIAKDTGSFEMRYIRLSIQSHLPSFLGYHEQIAADSHFLRANMNKQADRQLREMAGKLLNNKNIKN